MMMMMDDEAEETLAQMPMTAVSSMEVVAR
jgi:hypothetical protein